MGLNKFQERIIDTICLETGVNRPSLFSVSRRGEVVAARHIAYKILYNYTNITHVSLAKAFNKKGHASVSLALRSLQNLIETSKKHSILYDTIVNEIEKIQDEK